MKQILFVMVIVLSSGLANASQNLVGAFRPSAGNDPDKCFSAVEIRPDSNKSLHLHFDTEYSNGSYHRAEFVTCGNGAVHDINLPAGKVVTKHDTPALDLADVTLFTSKSWNTTQLEKNKFILRFDFVAKKLLTRTVIDQQVRQLTGIMDARTGKLTLNCYEYSYTKHSFYTKGPKEVITSCSYEKVP